MSSQSLVLMIHPNTLITSNSRIHWRTKARKVAELRRIAKFHINHADLHMVKRRQRIVVTFGFTTHRHRDPLNWEPSVKPLVDELVACRILPGDDTRWVVGPDLREGALSPDCQSQPVRSLRRVLVAIRLEDYTEDAA